MHEKSSINTSTKGVFSRAEAILLNKLSELDV